MLFLGGLGGFVDFEIVDDLMHEAQDDILFFLHDHLVGDAGGVDAYALCCFESKIVIGYFMEEGGLEHFD